MSLRLQIPLLALTLLIGTAPAMAGDIPWSSLSDDQQRILHRARDRWDDMPTERQQRLLRGAERWQHMDEHEREQARERWRHRREERRDQRRDYRDRD